MSSLSFSRLNASFFFLLAIVLAVNMIVSAGRYYCQSELDCEPGECCVMGMQRYTLPRCERFGQLGDYCRRGNEPQNRTLYYPNGISMQVSNVYTLFCPCDLQFTCHQATCQPRVGDADDVSNHLDNNSNE